MTEQVSSVVRNTTEQLSKLSEKSAADDIKDESYLAHIGGSQGFQLNTAQKQILQMQEEQKKAKVDKKKRGKKPPSPTYDPNREQDLEKAAAELVKKMAATRADLADWRPPGASEDAIEPEKEELQKPEIEGASDEGPIKALKEIENREPQPVENFADFAAANITSSQVPPDWAGFGDDSAGPPLPSSESDFFQKILQAKEKTTQGEDSGFGFDFSAESAPDAGAGATVDPFAPMNAEPSLINSTFDPFDTRPAEEIIAEAKQRAEYEHAKLETDQDLEFFAAQGSSPTAKTAMSASRLSTPTEMGSPASTAAAARPTGFEDDFKAEAGEYSHTPTPLYDEDDTLPLADFPDKFTGEGWELMLRHPLKKKIMADRYWKPCYVRLDGNMLLIYSSKQESKPFQEILLQASYSLSDTTLQAYDIYGKIHTVKLQHILYKERVGIRPGQISRLVEGHVTKYGLPLEHAAQATVLAKFGSLNGDDLATFVHCVEDLLFHCSAKRETTPVYKQDEVQVHCYDEYTAHIDRDGNVSNQRARVRLFCLTFLSGSPYIEIGLNDRRRQGKEIVRRKDILPMYTERWIRFEKLEFHNTVDQKVFEEDQVIKIQPPDGCFFEVMRFRIRPPKSREKPLSVKCLMRMAGSKIEIRIDAMANVHQQRAKGTTESTRTIPCEDIQIRFPIPEAWIYIFREERHWGVGSVHSKMRKPGKVKNLKDRLMGAVQHTEQTLIEVAIGEAKYEHLYRSLVWRIPRLPEKTQAAYKTHMLKCRFELSSFDLMPEAFLPQSELEFTMPLATISNTVVRSVSVEQHEDSDRVEKFVRYVAKCHYTVDVDYVQCHDLDDVEPNAAVIPSAENDELSQPKHVAAFNPETVQQQHEGYRIDLPENDGFGFKNYGGENGGGAVGSGLDMSGNGGIGAVGGDESSSDDEDVSHKVPMVEINMQGYGY
ncbi:adaptor complexes medium subunit family domain-containing protein [Ditylenchus destructor]|uniref:Adaptor complexes medium subunit family domain-containing protein n=1 Tax=Ditylenchus destructor TaxID=166010 RepID=A0AAD4N8Y5_9BILA|nr:adaptor complexes medium subunit family domain-containing protein [Ditylenchus destructor]